MFQGHQNYQKILIYISKEEEIDLQRNKERRKWKLSWLRDDLREERKPQTKSPILTESRLKSATESSLEAPNLKKKKLGIEENKEKRRTGEEENEEDLH